MSLYNYFTSKEAMNFNFIQIEFDRLYEENWSIVMEIPSTYERLRWILKYSAKWIESNKTEIYISKPKNSYFGPNSNQVSQNGFVKVFTEIFKHGQVLGDVTRKYTPYNLARQMFGTFYISIISWFDTPETGILEERLLEGLELFFSGCKAEKAMPCREIFNMFF